MKAIRILLALGGLAALGFGVSLFLDYALPLRPDVFKTLVWLVGAPVFHDAVIAPVVGVGGLLLSRVVPVVWKAPVMAGTVLTAVLGILAFPLLWRTYGTAPEPGLHDGNTWRGLLVTLAVVWALVVLTGVVRTIAGGGGKNRRPSRTASDSVRKDLRGA
ncbi:hypothetical protein [Amycolatopsis saalfeldensis]|uniref:Uncharacterized protein n=1 Tax=Amycolatopsis saalfeldensis TaxID=394193 RepID=A0A1H8WQH4_9PSEU|nr:hypothetical protein [Amycolatopsis saalfeldensis]SEP29882.1 hypothetical protein SAMN04489732_105416 [Amycolatopsis saalfeldensis]